MQAEATGIPLKAAKYDQVSTLVFNGRSPLINPGPQGAVQSLPSHLPEILISLTSLCAALGTCQRFGSQEGWQGLRTSYGRANHSLLTRWSRGSCLHSTPLLPTAPLCLRFPQLTLETSPQLLDPHRRGTLRSLMSGDNALSQAHSQGAERWRRTARNMAPNPNSGTDSFSGLQEVTACHRALLSPSAER